MPLLISGGPMTIRRREFLGQMAAGSAIVTMPAFLSGCGVNPATEVAAPTPDNPFMTWFGIDEAMITRVMAELTANGADTADLYFQHQRTNSLAMEDGIVSRANSGISQGVGLRVVIGEQTGYAFTEDLTLESMLAAARTAAAIANGSAVVAPQAYNPKATGDLYTTAMPWSDVGIDTKLPILRQVDEKARKADPAIQKVTVNWAD